MLINTIVSAKYETRHSLLKRAFLFGSIRISHRFYLPIISMSPLAANPH